MKSDLTRFFSSFFPEPKKKDGYDLSVGNIGGIPIVEEVLKEALTTITKHKLNNIVRYPGTQGYLPLNEKLAALIEKETGQPVNPEEIILTNGALDSLYHVFYALCNPKEYCYYTLPSFPYWSPADKAGVLSSTVIYQRPSDYAHSFGSIFQEKVRKNPRIKMILLNQPHNPIGKKLEPDQVRIINDVCEEKGIRLVLDDVYRSFMSGPWIGKGFGGDTIIVDSLSKRFGMPGIRLGFIKAPKPMVKYIRASMANQVVGVNMLTTLVADKVLDIALQSKFTQKIAKEIDRRQRALDSSLRKLNLGIVSEKPDGGIYRLLDLNGFLKETDATVMDVHKHLLDHHIKTVPGEKLCFQNVDPHKGPKVLRLSVGGETRTKEAGEKIVETIENIT